MQPEVRRLPDEHPDIVLLATEWQPRALIRAQLIEEGFDVVAMDAWSMARRHLKAGLKPRLAIVDLKGLPHPAAVLADLRTLMTADRVLVVTAIGTVPQAEIDSLGFRALSRPLTIQDLVRIVVETIGKLIRAKSPE